MAARARSQPAEKPKYRVLVHLDYPDGEAESGQIVDNLPPTSVPWLLSDGLIEEVTE